MSKEIMFLKNKLSIFLRKEDTFSIELLETEYKKYSLYGDQVYIVSNSLNQPIYVVKILKNISILRQERLEVIFNFFIDKNLIILPIKEKNGQQFFLREDELVYMFFLYQNPIHISSISDIGCFYSFYKRFIEYSNTLHINQDSDYTDRVVYFYNRISSDDELLGYSKSIVDEYISILPSIKFRVIHTSIWKNNILISSLTGGDYNFVDIDSLMTGDPYHEYFQIFCMIAELCDFQNSKIYEAYKPFQAFFETDPGYKIRFTYIIHFFLIKTLSHYEYAPDSEKYFLLKSVDCFNAIYLKNSFF